MKKLRLHPFFTQNKIAFLSIGVIFSSLMVGNTLSYSNPAIYKVVTPEKTENNIGTTNTKSTNPITAPKAASNTQKTETATKQTTTPAKTSEKTTGSAPRTTERNAASAPKTTPKTTLTPYQKCLTGGGTPSECRPLQTINPAPVTPYQQCLNGGGTPSECKALQVPEPTPTSYWGSMLPPDLTDIDPQSTCDPRLSNTCRDEKVCTAMARPIDASGKLLYPQSPMVYRCDTDPNVNNRNCEMVTDESGNYVSIQEGSIIGDGEIRCEQFHDPVLGRDAYTGYAFTQSICANGTIHQVEKTKTYNSSSCPPGNTNNPSNFNGYNSGGPACGSIVLGGNDTGATDFKDQRCCRYVDIKGQSPDGVPYKNMCSGLENVSNVIYDLFHNDSHTFGLPEFGLTEFIGETINGIFE